MSAVALLMVGGYFVLLTPVEGQEQPPPEVFLPVDASGWVDPLLPDDAILRSRPVAVNMATLALVTPPDPHAAVPTVPIRFNLFDDVSVTVVFHSAKPRYDIQIPENPFDLLGQEFEPVGYTWSGDIVGEHQGHAIMVTDVGVCVVNISVSVVGKFQVRRSGDVHVVREIGGSSSWECGMIDEGIAQSLGAGGPAAGGSAGCDDGSTIDVIILYTEAVRVAAGGTAEIEAEIDAAIQNTNDNVYPNSEIEATLRLVTTVETDNPQLPGTNLTHLCRLALPWDGVMDDVHPLRDAHRADLVMLLTDADGSSAYKMLQESPFFEYAGFSAVQHGGADIGVVIPHEFGHNMGCSHSREIEGCIDCPDCGGSCSSCSPGVFEHSFGHKFTLGQTAHVTIMTGVGGVQIHQFSNPNVEFCKGMDCAPTGVPAESPNCDSADNALTINTTRDTVANFRQSCDTTDTTTMASFDYSDGQGNGLSKSVSISDNGQYLAFASRATNWAPGDFNFSTDVFVYNRESGVVSPVSLNTDTQRMGNGASTAPTVSGDRHFVAFASDATNLITGLIDDNSASDIYVFDLFEPPFASLCPIGGSVRMTRVSVDSSEAQANGDSASPSISFDGAVVAFESKATNLVGDDTLGHRDIFLRDTQGGETSRISVSTAGAEANGASFNPAISSDSQFIAFESDADNLLDSTPDTNQARDIFVHDRFAEPFPVTFRVSVSTAGVQADGASFAPSISADGQLVAFESDATNLLGLGNDTNGMRDIFVRDLAAQPAPVTFRVSVASDGTAANGDSFAPVISADGLFVAFHSDADNLLGEGVDTNGQTDVFVYNVTTGEIFRASINSTGAEATGGGSFYPAISANGRFVAFESDATNLVSGDVTGFRDIFFHDRSCLGDLNGDLVVDAVDLAMLLAAWGPVPGCPPSIPADFDQNCDVGPEDLAVVLGAWGSCL